MAGGTEFTADLETLRVGRCDKGSETTAPPADLADPPAVLPSAGAKPDEFLGFWSSIGFPAEEAAALMTTHTLIDAKTVSTEESGGPG